MPYRNINFWRIPDLKKGPYHSRILNFVIEHIEAGTLPIRAVLPVYREIAKINDVHRHTMLRALNKLVDLGYLVSRRGSAIYVSPTYPGHEEHDQYRLIPKLPLPLPESDFGLWNFVDPSHDFLSIGFDIPCPSFFPYKLYSKYSRRLVESFGSETQMQIVLDMQGNDYKNAIQDYINLIRGFRLAADSMHIIMGRRRCLYATFKSILTNGDLIVNTAPKDTLLTEVLASLNIKTIALSTLDQDFIPKLASCLKTNPVKALYIRPQCGYPEGNHLDAELCKRLVDLAEEYSFYIVEEDEEHEFWHQDDPFDPLFCRKHQGHVLYLGALSMITSYMYNTRVIAGPVEFIERISEVPLPPFESRDILEEKIIIEMLRSGDFFKHLRAVQKIVTDKHYEQIRWEMTNYLGKRVEISCPSGGLSLYLCWKTAGELAEDMQDLINNGVQIPFMPWSPMPGEGIRHMRLGFGSWDIHEAQTPAKHIQERYNHEKTTNI